MDNTINCVKAHATSATCVSSLNDLTTSGLTASSSIGRSISDCICGAHIDMNWHRPNSLQVDDKFFGKPKFLPGTFIYRDAKNYIKRVSIDHVTYSNPATIVFWDDGTKTVAKCAKGDTYSAEAGLVICILKKLSGGSYLHDTLDAWLPTEAMPVGKTIVQSLKTVRKKYK